MSVVKSAGAFHSLVARGGKAFVWGQADKDLVDLVLSTDGSEPKLAFSCEKVKCSSVGDLHFAVVDEKSSLWMWGKGTVFRLGLGTIQTISTPTRLVLSEPSTDVELRVAVVDCGAFHSAAITVDGKLFVWGGNGSGQLGLGHFLHVKSPEIVEIAGCSVISAVSCGSWHTLVVSGDGKSVYAMGMNDERQLGVEAQDEYVNTPVIVKEIEGWVEKENDPIKCVSAGQRLNLAVSSKGRGLMWGARQPLSRIEVGSDVRLVSVSSGAENFFALSEFGDVFAWGDGKNGQLGLGKDVLKSERPSKIPFFDDWRDDGRITSISAGIDHSVAVAADGSVFTWGSGLQGQLGVSRTSLQYSPAVVNFPGES